MAKWNLDQIGSESWGESWGRPQAEPRGAALHRRGQDGDLQLAVVRDMESFLLELDIGFAFIARQKRIPADGDDGCLDLLFYHRKLGRLVAFDLKVDEFRVAYKGQMERHLHWLNNFERQPDEAAPLGIIVCAGKQTEQIELLELDKDGIRVAQYLADLPPRAVLAQRLQQAARRARSRIEQRAMHERGTIHP
ncbi:DUF1016 domain-containing protein [Achromobacter spanius]|uniref:PDDEXK nuclease domain-containing protein n=1 Tax=Achromobacter spanius TaxID=217203 RepID=UPI000F8F8385|nr:PDDEXK nuclease domain-containing protein [Achromobacter spanius]AZS79010.1 DUF1016 family protein [Achromobacter spanius]MCW3155447.1 DUF1016 domain-containing protein [Achromobacter spanius]